jgi:aspartate carbamoyltransferase catalytic subunit
MSLQNRHFINFSSLTAKDILSFFEKTNRLEPHSNFKNKNACMLFFEPSTRTQISFDLALRDCGIQPVTFNPETSSLKKGETVLDTLLNLEAMGFDLFVIRHGFEDENLKDLSSQIKTPIINAGEGMSGHPTQALLDVFTIWKERKTPDFNKLSNEKVLFVGDIKHSRVVQSNIELMRMLGIEVAICAPEGFLPKEDKFGQPPKVFDDLKDGMDWATVVMALRTQFERHEDFGNGISSYAKLKETFVKNYSISPERLKNWKKDGIVLHPGPFNRGIEIQSEILKDPRVCIFKQVENGRKIRRALVDSILGRNP